MFCTVVIQNTFMVLGSSDQAEEKVTIPFISYTRPIFVQVYWSVD